MDGKSADSGRVTSRNPVVSPSGSVNRYVRGRSVCVPTTVDDVSGSASVVSIESSSFVSGVGEDGEGVSESVPDFNGMLAAPTSWLEATPGMLTACVDMIAGR